MMFHSLLIEMKNVPLNMIAADDRGAQAIVAARNSGLLDKTRNPGHGPRFVGILIGLLARHLGRDADTLLATAYEAGIKVDARSIGAVPVFPWHLRVEPLLPCTAMEAAVELGVSYRVVRGAALQLIKRGVARWSGKTLVRVPAVAQS